jgi:hypothetical protein
MAKRNDPAVPVNESQNLPATTQQPNPSTDVVKFSFGGSGIDNLPEPVRRAIKQHGITVRQKAGVEPTWKPETVGAYILGEVIAIRPETGEFGGTVLVLNTEQGPQSVWLSADLEPKLRDAVIGQVYCIVYEGMVTKQENPKLKNDMRRYNVCELLPAAR